MIAATYGNIGYRPEKRVMSWLCSANGSAVKAPKRHSVGRQNAKITSAIAIQPAPPVRPSTHCGGRYLGGSGEP